MLNLTQIDCEPPMAPLAAEAACDIGLDHPHAWARERGAPPRGPHASEPQAVRLPSTVLHDDIHYAG